MSFTPPLEIELIQHVLIESVETCPYQPLSLLELHNKLHSLGERLFQCFVAVRWGRMRM